MKNHRGSFPRLFPFIYPSSFPFARRFYLKRNKVRGLNGSTFRSWHGSRERVPPPLSFLLGRKTRGGLRQQSRSGRVNPLIGEARTRRSLADCAAGIVDPLTCLQDEYSEIYQSTRRSARSRAGCPLMVHRIRLQKELRDTTFSTG